MSKISKYLDRAKALDAADDLAKYREQFISGEENSIYLDGNSLGKLHRDSIDLVEKAVKQEWGSSLIKSWNEDWYDKNSALGDKIAGICGASKGEIIVSDNTSINLYKLAHAALNFKKERKVILSDELNFPSDLYILEGLVKEFGEGYELRLVKSRDGVGIEEDDLLNMIDENTALVSLSHVLFKSAFRYDMKRITRLVQERGAMMLWDLSHSAGAVPGELNSSGADLAVGCTYKYLNGGPGSPAFLYVRKDLQDKLISPVWGWFGQENPFEFELNYKAAGGIRRFLTGTPPIVSMKAMEPSLDIMNREGMKSIFEKSLALTAFMIEMAEELLLPLSFSIGSPTSPDQRGSHITLRHKEAYRLSKALIDPGIGNLIVIPDFREPDNIRLGIAPLYTGFVDVCKAILEIRDMMESRSYTVVSGDRDVVT